MRTILTIAGREFKAYYTSPVGYVVMGCWFLFAGIIFALMMSQPTPTADMEPLFRNCTILLVMVLPLLSMRLLAGERSGDQGTGTIEILLTSPVSEWQLVLGKYLAAVGYMFSLVVVSLIYPLTMKALGGKPDMGKIVGGYVGFLLFSGYILALGMLFSSLTNSQIVAAICTIVGALSLWLISFMSQNPSKLVQFFAWFSMLSHHEDFWRGVVPFVDVAWFASFIYFYLFATKLVMASSRWR
jgi:ABC-2 type transport system permease protein